MISPMEPSPCSPSVELDGGEQAIRFSLAGSINASSFSTLQNRRQIFVRRQAWNDSNRILAVVERTISGATGETIRESERFLDLRQDLVLPVYAIPRPVSRVEWNIEMAYGQGALRVDYPFGTRDDVLRFQEVLTNYAPVEHFDDITFVVTYRGWGLQKPQYTGFGHIQLWKQPEKRVQPCPRSPRSPISSTGSSNSTFLGRSFPTGSHSNATSPTVRSQPASIASVQTGYSHAGSMGTVQTYDDKGTSVLVTQDFRPPVMVAFLKDKGRSEGYSMVKVDITNLKQSEFTNKEEALLSLGGRSNSTFRADKHLPVPGRVPLSAWNLCEQQKKGTKPRLVHQLECSGITLSFGSCKDPANMDKRERLDRCMLELQMGYLKRLSGQTATRDMDIVAMSEEMRAPPPAVFPPTMTTPRLSRIYEPPELLPEVPRQGGIGTEFIAHAGTVNSVRAAMTAELDIASGGR